MLQSQHWFIKQACAEAQLLSVPYMGCTPCVCPTQGCNPCEQQMGPMWP